jgi:hypothetical protein
MTILFFRNDTIKEVKVFKHILAVFCTSTGMEINEIRSLIHCPLAPLGRENIIRKFLHFGNIVGIFNNIERGKNQYYALFTIFNHNVQTSSYQ